MWQELQIRRYLWNVSRELPGNKKQKKHILSRVENSVREFASEQPCADYAVIVKWFGPPKKIAESYVTEMGAAELVQELRIRQKIVYILLVTTAIFLTIKFVYSTASYFDHLRDMRGYAVVEVIEVERTEYTEGGD